MRILRPIVEAAADQRHFVAREVHKTETLGRAASGARSSHAVAVAL